MVHDHLSQPSKNFRFNFGLLVFTLVAGFFLVTEHKAHLLGLYAEHEVHILGALPYLLLLLCPLMHLFMHGGHGGHKHGDRK
jgi:hypothetical protein